MLPSLLAPGLPLLGLLSPPNITSATAAVLHCETTSANSWRICAYNNGSHMPHQSMLGSGPGGSWMVEEWDGWGV